MPNVTIRDLPPVTIPITVDDTFLEVSVLEAGVEVSRKVAADALQTAIGLDASFLTVGLNAALPNERVITAGTNISIVDGGPNTTLTINVVGLALSGLSDVDLTGQATGDLLFNQDGTNWNDTAGLLRIDEGLFEFQSNYSITALGGIFLRNANGDVFLDNVFLGGGLFQYSVAVGGNDALTLRDNGLAQFGMSGGTENSTLISGAEVRLVRGGVDEIALSLAPAAGGLSVNNLLTGAGLERVLTESDAGAGSVDTFNYQFSTSTSMTDPGAGFVRLNNATLSSVTSMSISITDADGTDLDPDLARVQRSTVITLRDPADPTRFAIYSVNGAQTDGGTHWLFPLSFIDGGTLPLDNAGLGVQLRDTPDFDSGFILTGTILTYNDTIDRYEANDGDWRLTNDGSTSQLHSNDNLRFSSSFNIQFSKEFFVLEQAAADTSVATWGQVWIRNDVPNTLMFTDDTGADFIVSGALDPSQEAIHQYSWLFSTTTAQADPGTNTLRFNNATPASITFIYIDDTGPDGQDLGSLIVSQLTDGFQLVIEDPTDADTIQWFVVSGSPTDFTGFWRIPVINITGQSGSAIPGDGAAIQIRFNFQQFLGQGTLSGNSKDMLFWDGDSWNNTGATTRINPNRPAIGGAFALSGSGSVDRTTAMLNIQIGTSQSAIWFAAGTLSTDGGYCHGDMIGTETIVWGWDIGAVVNDLFFMDENLRVGITAAAGFVMAEKAADHGNIAAFGEFWVRNDIPNVPMFTDDTGADFVLNAGGITVTGTPVNNQLAVWTAANDLEGDAGLTWDGTTLSTGLIVCDIQGIGLFMVDGAGGGTPPTLGISGDTVDEIDFDFANVVLVNFNSGGVYDFSDDIIRSVSNLYVQERAASQGDISNQGQFWVRSDNPNNPRFVDGDGAEQGIALTPGRLTTNNSFDFNTAGNRAENFIGSFFDGGNDTITLEDSGSEVNWPIGVAIQIINPGSGVTTITEGSGVTLFLDDGTDTVGGVTITQGVVTIFRQTAANYIVWGSGIT